VESRYRIQAELFFIHCASCALGSWLDRRPGSRTDLNAPPPAEHGGARLFVIIGFGGDWREA
jgi:hypothetical protein